MKRQQGFIGIALLVILALVALKYLFDFSIFEAASTPQGQAALDYTKKLLSTIWSYISTPVIFVWDKILWPLIMLIWNNFQTFLDWGSTQNNLD